MREYVCVCVRTFGVLCENITFTHIDKHKQTEKAGIKVEKLWYGIHVCFSHL